MSGHMAAWCCAYGKHRGRIAAYRRRRGISQAALASLVGRSESWLSQVERGLRSVDRLSVLLDMSEVLHVDVQSLVGRPWQYAPNGYPVVDGLDDIRLFFTQHDDLLGVEPGRRSSCRRCGRRLRRHIAPTRLLGTKT